MEQKAQLNNESASNFPPCDLGIVTVTNTITDSDSPYHFKRLIVITMPITLLVECVLIKQEK